MKHYIAIIDFTVFDGNTIENTLIEKLKDLSMVEEDAKYSIKNYMRIYESVIK